MAVSVIEICNNALLDLGEDTIMSLGDETKAARLCNQRWPGVRDAVLRTHPWNCCAAQAVLAAASEAPSWRWSAAYPLPLDCLRVLRVAGSSVSSTACPAARSITFETVCSRPSMTVATRIS